MAGRGWGGVLLGLRLACRYEEFGTGPPPYKVPTTEA